MKISFLQSAKIVLAIVISSVCCLCSYGQPDPMRIWENLLRKNATPKPTLPRANNKNIQDVSFANRTTGNRRLETNRLITDGNAALGRGEFIEAEKLFRKALLYDPRNASGYEGLGVV